MILHSAPCAMPVRWSGLRPRWFFAIPNNKYQILTRFKNVKCEHCQMIIWRQLWSIWPHAVKFNVTACLTAAPIRGKLPGMAADVLCFDDLERYLLLKNGNYLYRIPFRGTEAVLKLYYGSRSRLRYLAGTISNYAEGQTSFMPRARRENELKCLKIWREAGFRVFDTYDDAVIEGLPAGGYLLFEYIPAMKLNAYFGDESFPLEHRLETYRRFLGEWHRRHDLAVRSREPRLVHENGDLKHVMMLDDAFLYFDFEMSYRSGRHVADYVSREILAYLKSLGKIVGPERFPLFLQETLQHYAGIDLLEHTHRLMFSHPHPILRLARRFDYRFRARARKPFSKYHVARRLHDMLQGQS